MRQPIYSDDAKTMITKLYQVQHAKGKLRRDFVADMKKAGCKFSESQLDPGCPNSGLLMQLFSPLSGPRENRQKIL